MIINNALLTTKHFTQLLLSHDKIFHTILEPMNFPI